MERTVASWILNDTPSKAFPLYSRANVGEVFPAPISPLNATTGFLANLEPGWRAAYVACGVWDHDVYDAHVEHNPIACFGGYLFINMSLMRLFGVRVPGFSPEAVDAQYFGDMPGIPSYESEARPFDVSEEWSGRAGAWLVGEVLGGKDLASLDAERAEVRAEVAARPDLSSLSSARLAARFSQWNPMFQRLFQTHIEVSLKAGIGLGAVAQATAAMGVPELSLTLVAGIGEGDSAGASLGMWELGRLAAAERGSAGRLAASGQLRGALAGNEEVLGQFNAALHAAELWCRARERQRTTVAMLVHEQRLTALELARRGVAAAVIERPEQIFMLLADELDTFVHALDGQRGAAE